QFGHDFAGVKAKVPRDPVALLRCRIVRGRSHRRYERERNCACDADANGIHEVSPWMRGSVERTSAALKKNVERTFQRCAAPRAGDNVSASGSGFPFVSGKNGTAISPRM